ncbi:thiamine phosphate synthase [Thiomicrospira pelophila]|uniref:thiamine phosphate synthase n=1 Tax=Thiomicrospira pelophila TaxID=934 RepID=UPI0004A76CF1|nr:thiamine phosphate synthase [Thiomicrospira pelophila]
MPIQGLYAITDPALSPGLVVIEHVRQALEGGARIVQYRDKSSDFDQQLETARQLKTLCEHYQAWLIINDSIELTKQSQAHGIHIGQNDAALNEARAQLGHKAIIGVSCYNDLDRAHQMQKLGADYVAFGRFFNSKTKPHAPPADLDTLTQARAQLHIPIVAIGGVTAQNAPPLIQSGAHSVAIIQGLFAQANIRQAATDIASLFNV